MYSQKRMRRQFRVVAFLLFSSLLLIAAWLSGLSTKAQTTTIPLGTYVASVTEEGTNSIMTISEYKVTFMEGGAFQMGFNDWITANGTYAVVGDHVEFTLPFGVAECANKGVYQWSLTGNKLTLAVAPGQTDDCQKRWGRKAQTYYKIDPAESFWKNVGPTGGTISALLFHDGKIFAGTLDPSPGGKIGLAYGAGIFVSADNGQSWQPARGTRGFRIFSLAAYNGMLFAGTQNGRMFISLDGGQTWEINNNEALGSSITPDFAVSNGKLYAAAPGQGVWRLTDNPYVWEKAGTAGLTNLSVTSLATIGGNLFAGTDGGGVFVSTDGNNWMPVNKGITLLRISTLAVDGNRLFAGTSAGTPTTTPNEVFVTDDNGQNWTRVGNGLAASFPAGFFNQIFKLAPSGGKLFAASSTGLIVNDGGAWRIALQGSPFPSFFSVAANGNQVLGGSFFDGVSRSLDGGVTWVAANNGLTARTINAVLKANGVLYIGTSDGGFTSNDEGQSWSRTNLPINITWNFLNFDNKVWAGTSNGVYVTTNQGLSWTRVSNGLGAGNVWGILALNNNLYATVYGAGVFRSDNGGQNWTAVNTDLTSFNINDIFARGNYLFVGTEDRGVFRSVEGQSWSPVNNGLPTGGIGGMTITGNTLLTVVWGQGTYRSTDNGDTWTKSSTGHSPGGIFTLYTNGTNVYASGIQNVGALRSTDGGQSWSPINTGFDARYAYGFFADGSTLYAATTFGVCISNNLVNRQTTVSAASYSPTAISEKSIVAAFGVSMATGTEPVTSQPLPTMLAGTVVKVRDSNGVERLAPLFYVSPDQINYQVPAGTAVGTASVAIVNSIGVGATGTMEIRASAPSIFTANSLGSGAAAAVDAITGSAAPFNAKRSGGEPNIIAVFGTGLGTDATDADGDVRAEVTARIDGNMVTMWYAGRAPGYVGLNQFNIELPAGITSGTHTLTLTRAMVTSNIVTIEIR